MVIILFLYESLFWNPFCGMLSWEISLKEKNRQFIQFFQQYLETSTL